MSFLFVFSKWNSDYGFERQIDGSCTPAFWFVPSATSRDCITGDSFLNTTGYINSFVSSRTEGTVCAQMPLVTVKLNFLENHLLSCVKIINKYILPMTGPFLIPYALWITSSPYIYTWMCMCMCLCLFLHSCSAHLCLFVLFWWILDIAGLCLTTALKELCCSTAPDDRNAPVRSPGASSSSPVREHW